MKFILRHVEKDVFLPREALENRRDVNPVAFLEKGLSLPSTATWKKNTSMLWQWSQQLNTRKEIKKADFWCWLVNQSNINITKMEFSFLYYKKNSLFSNVSPGWDKQFQARDFLADIHAPSSKTCFLIRSPKRENFADIFTCFRIPK